MMYHQNAHISILFFLAAGTALLETNDAAGGYATRSFVNMDVQIESIQNNGASSFFRSEKLRSDSAGGCTVYPNPVQEEVYIRWPYRRPGKIHVALSTTDGRVIFQTEIDSKPVMRIDMPQITPGLYRILLTQEGQQTSATLHKM